MTQFTITLSDSQKEFVESQMSGRHATVSDYIQAMLERARKRQEAWKKVDQLLIEGLNSGEPIEVNAEYWESKRREFIQRFPGVDEQ